MAMIKCTMYSKELAFLQSIANPFSAFFYSIECVHNIKGSHVLAINPF